MSTNPEEVFTDDMNEEELVEAFMKASNTEAKEEEEPQQAEEETSLEQPTEEAETEVDAMESTEEEATKEESSSDVIDFTKPVLLKDRDLELPVNNSKELLDLARQGLNFTRKTQDFAKSKPLIDYANKHGLSLDDLQLLAEAKSGNPDAIGKLARDSKIDAFDIDTDKQWTPNEDYKPTIPNAVEEYAQELAQDVEVATKFRSMMEYVPSTFKEKLSTDLDTLKGFSEDVRNGVAEKLMPEAVKLYAINGGDFVQSYIQAGNKIFGQGQQAPVQETQQVAPTPPKPVSENRAKAGISSSGKGSSNSMEFDTWGSSDEEFLAKINAMTQR